MGRKAVSYLLYVLSVLFTALLLAAAILSWRASFISPGQGSFWAVIALLMPVILLLNALALVWWLVRGRWGVALLPFAALLFNLGFVSSMIQLPDISRKESSAAIRIATLNVNGFRWLENRRTTARAVVKMVEREEVDILCLQEFMDEKGLPADSIGALFEGRMPYFVHGGSEAIVSRYPILDHRYVGFHDTSNDYLRADLKIGGDTVRIFSVHLQTSGIAQLRRRFRKDYGQDFPMEAMRETLERNSVIRAEQVREIRAQIDASPYPVILAGDFNDTPSSYTYRMMKGTMTDGFRDVGEGYGGTFRYLGGVLRIDYIFYDGNFNGVRYSTLDDRLSDHKAVVAELHINE